MNSGDPGGSAVPAPLVISFELLLKKTNIIWYGNRVGQQYALINI